MIAKGGFLGLSNRENRKPIIAALNGSTFGGGTEAVINCDLAIAVSTATFQFPEVRVGVVALAGALPRLARNLGLKRANELTLLAEPISAQKALEWGIINKIVEDPKDLLPTALDFAKKILKGNPDGTIVSLKGVRRGLSDTKLSLVEATEAGYNLEFQDLRRQPNLIEGMSAFLSKRIPRWKDSKL